MSYFLGALQQLFTIECMLSLVIGTVGGMLVGALPGLSAIMAVSLLLPVSFKMTPSAGLVLLVSVYTSAIYGGSITACLINTPGTPSSAATTLDGFPLTKQGKGLKAVGMATLASMVGGTISSLALLLISPQLAKVSLKFSSLEYFFLALLGLTIIGSVSGKSVIKGLMSGCFGFLAGLIGTDIFNGKLRFTFGVDNLSEGITLVSAMIGFFAVGQVVNSYIEFRQGKKTILETGLDSLLQGSPLPTKDEWKEVTPTLLRSSVLGVLIGILPGAGADIGSWVAYNLAKNRSKHPEKFGHGALEGVAASEAANNAVTGGALIPMLTLGIPGSSTCAVMLGGMMIQGLVPGYDLFDKQGATTYCIILGFMLANILMGIIGLFIAKPVVRISTVNKSILCPIIIGLAVIGSYAINSWIFDVVVMLAFGIIGILFARMELPVAPFVLGLILGPMAEQNFRQALIISRGDMIGYFFSRPISIALLLLTFVSLFSPIFMKWFTKKTMGDPSASEEE